MRVVQLIGPYAGQVVEMPHHVGTSCIASGTACLPGKVHLMSIKGLNTDRFDEEALTGKIPDDEPVDETITDDEPVDDDGGKPVVVPPSDGDDETVDEKPPKSGRKRLHLRAPR